MKDCRTTDQIASSNLYWYSEGIVPSDNEVLGSLESRYVLLDGLHSQKGDAYLLWSFLFDVNMGRNWNSK